MFGRASQIPNNLTPFDDQFDHQTSSLFVDPDHESSSSNILLNNKEFLSSNTLLNRIIERHNASHLPMKINARNFYTHLNLMTIKWTQSLSQRK